MIWPTATKEWYLGYFWRRNSDVASGRKIVEYGVIEGADRFMVAWHQQDEAKTCARQGERSGASRKE